MRRLSWPTPQCRRFPGAAGENSASSDPRRESCLGSGGTEIQTGPAVGCHHAEPAGSRGLHGAMVAEGGKVDAGLTGHRQPGPAIFTTDFPVRHGEIGRVPPATFKNHMNLSSYQLLCLYRILSKYGILCIFFFRKEMRGFHAFWRWRRAAKGIMPQEPDGAPDDPKARLCRSGAGEGILPG